MTTTTTPGSRVVNLWFEAKGERWDHLRVRRLHGREAIGELFSFDVEVACDLEHEIPERVRCGEEVSLAFEIDGLEVRRVHGVIARIRTHLGAAGERPTLRIGVVPRAARLMLVETQEIFLEQTIPDIVRAKLERHDLTAADFDFRLVGKYAPREFVMQHRETDLAFVSRLCEHVGISFFFEHGGGHDRIVFTDHAGGFTAGDDEIPFQPAGETSGVFALDRVGDLTPTSHIVQDYNYRAPLVDLSACSDIPAAHGGGVVEYGCHVKTPEEAEHLARVRAEERRSRQVVYEGKSGTLTLSAGGRAAVSHVPDLPSAEEWLFVEVTHEAEFPLFGQQTPNDSHYKNSFVAVPPGFTYRPRRATPKPSIAGVITGVVQPGPEGETGGLAQIDAEGRYTVTLHLDTAELGGRKSSHPIRMAQPTAGTGYGMHFPLRPGVEVIVAFVNGDPDRPLIVGAVPNPLTPTPVAQVDRARNRIRTASGVILEINDGT